MLLLRLLCSPEWCRSQGSPWRSQIETENLLFLTVHQRAKYKKEEEEEEEDKEEEIQTIKDAQKCSFKQWYEILN